MAACPDAGRILAPLQLGVGVRGGSQLVGHALRAGMAADPDCVTVQLDYRNAFNTLARGAMLAAVAKRQPSMLPFAAWTYRHPSRLLVSGAPDETPPILSECGVRQGDPCGMLYFALTVQDHLEQIRLTHPAAAPLALADDTFLQGPSAAVVAAYPALRDLAATVGLDVVPDKCGVFSLNAEAAAATAAELGLPHRDDGLKAAGTPVGTDAFVAATATSVADTICASIAGLLDSPLPAQDKFILLRCSSQTRIAHLPRIAPWALVGDAVQRVEEAVIGAAFTIMDRPEQAGVRAGQLTLPLRHGGMGIRTTSALEARAAFLSAAAMTETTMRAGPQQFQPFAGPGAPALEADWQALHAAGAAADGPPLWPPDALPITAASIDDTLPGAQRAFSRFVAECRFDELIDALDGATLAGQRALARLRSCSCRAASIWIDTLPVSPALQLQDAHFRTAMRLRRGLAQAPSNAPGVRCFCGTFLQPDDLDHAMTCLSIRKTVTLRHNMLTATWRRIASRSGVTSTAEPLIRQLPGAQGAAAAARPDSRGDLLLILPSGLTVVDISVIHPAAASYVRAAARSAGSAAATRDARKRALYRTADPNGYAFTPLSVETYGRLGEPAMELLNALAGVAAAGGTVFKAGFVTNALRELSITLCRGNGALYRAGLGVFARVTGHAFHAGLPNPTAEIV